MSDNTTRETQLAYQPCNALTRVTSRDTPAWPPAWLAPSSAATASSDAQWNALSRQRWGPSLEHDLPSIIIPHASAGQPVPLTPNAVESADRATSDGRVDSEGEPAKTTWPPRDPRLAGWPIPRRQRWGERANALEDTGVHWAEAERLAFEEVLNEASTEGSEGTTRRASDQLGLAYSSAADSGVNERRAHP